MRRRPQPTAYTPRPAPAVHRRVRKPLPKPTQVDRHILRLKFTGRWGNKIGQYCAVRTLAERLGCTLEVPAWEGREVFPATTTDKFPTDTKLLPTAFDAIPSKGGFVLHGYWQYQQALDLMRRSTLRQWLAVDSKWLALCPRPKPFYVAAHLRRGDYLKHKGKFAVVTRLAFEKAIVAAGYNLADVVWVSEEAPGGAGVYPPHLSFLHDFLLLWRADVVFRANSTFSFWAAALGQAKEVWSPRVGRMVGEVDDVTFEKGNHCANFSVKIHPTLKHGDLHLPD